jgi:hypothetical protein
LMSSSLRPLWLPNTKEKLGGYILPFALAVTEYNDGP